MDGGNKVSATPVYQRFVGLAKQANPSYISMIMPAKWYNGGKGLDDFRSDMLSDKCIAKLFDYVDGHECFPTVDIAGGVCYFLWDSAYSGKCNVKTISNNNTVSSLRDLNEFETFIRHDKAVQIIHKVQSHKEPTLDSVVFSRKPFGLGSNDG